MQYKDFVLAIDIGGTNTAVGVFGAMNRKRFSHIYSYFYETKNIRSPEAFIRDVIEGIRKEHDIKVTKCCLSAAGPIENGVCKLTNTDMVIDTKKVLLMTKLKKFRVINDFQAISYGIEPMELLDRRSFSLLKRGKKVKRQMKAVIGAGTGLGKSFLVYDGRRYVSMPSEGGHEAFSPVNDEEFRLMEFIKKKYKLGQVNFEHLVSGGGLSNIYEFVSGKKVSPSKVASLYGRSENARKAFDMFVKFYARAAKNYTLDILPYSGLYLAGGIIMRDLRIFDRAVFKTEFLAHPNRNHRAILKSIPVYAIKNSEISLYGDVYYMMNFP